MQSSSTAAVMAPVTLNVYDLTTQMNSWTYWCGVGVFHAGVEVYGIEYAYGGEHRGHLQPAQPLLYSVLQPPLSFCLRNYAGHDYDVSGIFATRPREAPGAGA